jgi:hypothetical protein
MGREVLLHFLVAREDARGLPKVDAGIADGVRWADQLELKRVNASGRKIP